MDGHAEAYIRLVGTIFVHGIIPAHARKRIRNIHIKDILEERPHHLLECIQHILLLHERHFAVNLRELWLTVGAEVLITEATYYLEVTVISGNHEQLLECLRRLRQCVELAGIHSGRNDEVTRALWCRLDEIWGFNLHESLGIQEITDLMSNLVTKHEGILQRISPEVKISVFRTNIIAAVTFIFDCKRRCDRLVQDMYGAELDLDFAGIHLGILALALDNLALHLNHELTTERIGHIDQLCRSISTYNQLGDSVTVTEVNECHTTKFPGFLHPA